jgi:hypothetical protein
VTACSIKRAPRAARSTAALEPGDYPRYNDPTVFRKGTHNSYFLNVSHSIVESESNASGTQERIIDQLLYEHARSLELDLHYEGGHPGEFTIYHASDAETDSNCHYLTDCLELIRRFEHVVPNHETLNIILEFKEVMNGPTFDDTHGPRDLDRQLWEVLGPVMYTPRELMETQCPNATTLRDCFAQGAQWPTTDQLRGRVIVNVMGNWADDYFDWIHYGAEAGDIRTRAAFPMRSVMKGSPQQLADVLNGCQMQNLLADDSSSDPLHAWLEINHDSEGDLGGVIAVHKPAIFGDYANDNKQPPTCVQGELAWPDFRRDLRIARAQSIFWHLETPDAVVQIPDAGPPIESLDDFVQHGGFTRSRQDDAESDQQAAILWLHNNIILTDYPWHFIQDDPANHTAVPLPTLASRPLFQECELFPGNQACLYKTEALTEPGNRLFLNGAGTAYIVNWNQGTNDWQTQPSATVNSHADDKHSATQNLPFGQPDGRGCLYAKVSGYEYKACRFVNSADDRRPVSVIITSSENGVTQNLAHVLPHQSVAPGDVGDLLRMTVTIDQTGSTVQFYTAAVIGPDGNPIWTPILPDGQIVKPGLILAEQGIEGDGSVLFSGTKLNGNDVKITDLTRPPNLVDQSFCLDGSCRTPGLPDHRDLRTRYDGTALVGVNEATGSVFGQARHVYTTDRFEALTSGLESGQTMSKFLLAQNAGPGLVPLYRCMDMRRDYHTFYLSTDASCPNDAGPAGLNGGVLGYVYATSTGYDHLAPLYHVRQGTSNAGSENTHDHVYAVGIVEEQGWVNNGFSYVGQVGWVLVPGYESKPPCVPRTCGSNCGAIADGCGYTLDCGTCGGSGNICDTDTHLCINPDSNAGCHYLCKHLCDGLTGQAYYNCHNQQQPGCDAQCDCQPQTCAGLGIACGSASDGCGNTLSCGTCTGNTTCSSGQCVAKSCDCGGVSGHCHKIACGEWCGSCPAGKYCGPGGCQ